VNDRTTKQAERRNRVAAGAVTVLAMALTLAVGCSSSGPARDEDPGIDVEPRQYTVRGELVTVPETVDETTQIRIKHEAMPDLVGHDGEVSGMASMTMPFSMQEGLSLEGLAVGDKVEFVLDVDWNRMPGMLVTEIRKLPPETELTF
jgi:Cu/Ag efflux protein CusF